MNPEQLYPGGYLEHWLAMFSVHQDICSTETIEQHITMYKGFEGEDEFAELKNQVQRVLQNDHLKLFLPVFQKYKEDAVEGDLELMIRMINDA